MYGLEIPDEPPAEGSTVTVTWAHRDGENYEYTGDVRHVENSPGGYRVTLDGTFALLIADSDDLAVYSHKIGEDEPDRVGVLTDIAMDATGDGDPTGVAKFLNAADAECRACGTVGEFTVEDGETVCYRCALAPGERDSRGGGS